MSKHLQRDLENVHLALLSLSAIVEEMIDKASRALIEGDIEQAGEVIRTDEQVNQGEVHIEEECLKMLALHQPVAIDLRRISTVMKVNNDLERIADLAVNIAERAQNLAAFPQFPAPNRLEKMVTLATRMVHGALDSFVNLDTLTARRVCLLDEEMDDYNRRIIGELQEQMRQDPELIVPAMHAFSASRHLERIADHATNIAEDVIYLVEGEIARHKPEMVHLDEAEADTSQLGAEKS